ncbi:3-methyl-2-oxobutanoate dehydrogenase subunit VorB [candidate division WOR-3 bacterium]|nr:3-methyl-2-oxobutanoate dehydrogenase subunit VorB [candidate division WOR-3 bacterium]
MAKELIKGNYAVVKAAILAGAETYFGYPITPASEIAEGAALYFPKLNRVFLQAESEVASINMLYGSGGAGVRTMTASSGPGISLMQEGISYAVGSEVPCLIVNVQRAGPGLGNIAPEQADYNQSVKGGGHGSYKLIVLAPNSAQEMCDLTIKGLELSDKYRTPVVLLSDAFIGQMMEPVDFPDPLPQKDQPKKPWATHGTKETMRSIINSIYLEPLEMEDHINRLLSKFKKIQENETMHEEYMVQDAEILLVGYGITSRVLMEVVEIARKEGIKAGLFRPITLWPFPNKRLVELAEKTRDILVVEMSDGQLFEDVKLQANCKKGIHSYTRMGGIVPTSTEILQKVKKIMGRN